MHRGINCFGLAPEHLQFRGLPSMLAGTDFLAEVTERDLGPGCMLERCRQRLRGLVEDPSRCSLDVARQLLQLLPIFLARWLLKQCADSLGLAEDLVPLGKTGLQPFGIDAVGISPSTRQQAARLQFGSFCSNLRADSLLLF